MRNSAFSYCGQKCSACSRAIVLDGVHDHFLQRLVESTRTLAIGDPALPGTDFGPVIDESAAAKIREYIEIGKREGRLELACEVPKGLAEKVGKPYVGPHIFSGIGRQHRLANEEVFGPVLAVMRVGSFEEALDVANSTAYKLTGGVFSRKPAPPGGRPTRFPRRQPVSQPRHHRSVGGPAAVRRLRPFRRRHQGRRRRLPACTSSIPAARREHDASRLRAGIGRVAELLPSPVSGEGPGVRASTRTFQVQFQKRSKEFIVRYSGIPSVGGEDGLVELLVGLCQPSGTLVVEVR